jgi:signal transduction histidine kinase/ActR/RegA family two-component response regulator
MRGIARAEQGTYRLVSQLDGIERVHAYQRVGTYPVYVSYGYGLRSVEREWRANLLTFGIVTGLASLALLALSLLAMRRARREQMVFADYRAEVARREEAEARLRQSQKMEAVGQLTGGVAHDFNNLLTVVTGSLDMLRRRMEEAPARNLRLVENALEGARRAATLTHHLLAFSRQQPLDPKPLDPNRLVAGMSELLRRTLNEAIDIETVLAGGLWRAHADPNQLENAILNLAVNARDAMPEGGKLTIETANTALDGAYAASRPEVKAGQYVMISLSDTGLGMSREVLERVFEPFFTTKPVGKGTGLGLAQVYGFMKQSGGHAAIYSEPGQGTTVKLYLPRYRGADEVVDRAEPGMDRPPVGSGETILVVEDDEMVRRFTVEALGEAGYRVLEASDGPAGLRLLDKEPQIALLFTDVVLAGPLNGRKLADAALQRRPDLKVVFTTGYTRNAIIHHGRLDEGVNFLGKPFTSSDLLHKVTTVLREESST